MPAPGQEETVRIVALDRDFHVQCYRCEVSAPSTRRPAYMSCPGLTALMPRWPCLPLPEVSTSRRMTKELFWCPLASYIRPCSALWCGKPTFAQ